MSIQLGNFVKCHGLLRKHELYHVLVALLVTIKQKENRIFTFMSSFVSDSISFITFPFSFFLFAFMTEANEIQEKFDIAKNVFPLLIGKCQSTITVSWFFFWMRIMYSFSSPTFPQIIWVTFNAFQWIVATIILFKSSFV